MLKRLQYPFFVFLLAPFFVLNGFTDNLGFVPVIDALKLLGVYLAATLILFIASYLVFRNKVRAAIFSFCLMALHFFFGAIHDTLKDSFNDTLISRYKILLPLIGISILLLLFFLLKTKKTFRRFTLYLNLVLIIFILIEIVTLSYKSIFLKNNNKIKIDREFTICNNCELPDLYVIIADEYAGRQSLMEVFNFDNDHFLQSLQSRGFRVLPKSNSNYNFTPYSIASTLNMNYLGNAYRTQQELLNHTYTTTRNNALLQFMMAQGYVFYNYSLLDYPNYPSHAQSTFLPVKTRLITSQTFLSRVSRDLRFNLITKFKSEKEKKRVVYTPLKNNEELMQLTENISSIKTKKPKFILTHLMMPHYPYYFNKNGEPYPYEQLTEGNQVNKGNYIEYLQYSNGRLLRLIDEIKKNSEKPPVIVLMSDHGFRHLGNDADPSHFFDNLIALHIAGSDYTKYHDTISNVNLFRTLLNNQFNQKLNYLADSTFIMENP